MRERVSIIHLAQAGGSEAARGVVQDVSPVGGFGLPGVGKGLS